VTKDPPYDLDQLVSYLYPDALWVTFDQHSAEVWTVNVLDLDYRYTVWRANLSLDDRWTLSPIAGPWQGTPVRITDW
jgi:hypothetical protein